ncbi:MAG: ABC transporter ATP-binding protein [Acidobacteriota bacterium]|jgi:ABC-type multidrug transport system ATPase subunit
MISIHGLSKMHDKTSVLSDIDLTVARGKVFGLAGTNGSGRTTLLEILATLRKPTAGSVEIDGINAIQSPFEVRSRIGYVPDRHDFHAALTVREFLDFLRTCRNVKSSADNTALPADGWLHGLKMDAPIGSLSRGLKQQLAWAAALIHAPAVLLLDEPMNDLDPFAAARCADAIKEMRSRGGTVVMASNRTADLQVLCDEVGFLHKGRLLQVMKVEGLSMNLLEILTSLLAQQEGSDWIASEAQDEIRAGGTLT